MYVNDLVSGSQKKIRRNFCLATRIDFNVTFPQFLYIWILLAGKSIQNPNRSLPVEDILIYLMHIFYSNSLKRVPKSNKRLDLSIPYILFKVHFLANLHDNHVRNDRCYNIYDKKYIAWCSFCTSHRLTFNMHKQIRIFSG